MSDEMRRALADPRKRRAALVQLKGLPPEDTLAVTDLVVDATISHGTAILAREVLGRLSPTDLEAVLPEIVRARLDIADDDEFRRLAEALAYLGLNSNLAELAERAKASADPHVREVGSDFSW